MKGRYRNTWAGFMWVILNPIIMFGVHALVFKHILNINMDRYYVFLLGGLLPWIFISSTITMTAHTLITNREVLLSFQVSPMAILCSKVIDNFINFLAPFSLLFVVLYFQEGFNILGILSLPISMLLLVITGYSMSVFFSILQVYFRDTQYILNFLVSIMYFLTPIFYPIEMVPKSIVWIVHINPIYSIVRPLQIALWDYDLQLLSIALAKALITCILSCFLAFIFWRKKRNELYLYL